jgi:hypothetical protein
MSDLISKGELFNALATAKDKADCFAAIQAAPTVDAAPVIRCKDCKWRATGYCPMRIADAPTNDFCSYGEKDMED